MKRKHQRTLELIFARPTSANVQWRDIEGLFLELGAEVSEREGSRVAVVLFEEVRVFHRLTRLRTQTRVLSPVSEGGSSNTESFHEYYEFRWLPRED